MDIPIGGWVLLIVAVPSALYAAVKLWGALTEPVKGRGVSAVEVAQELADIATGKATIDKVTVAGDVVSIHTENLYLVVVLNDGQVDGVIEAQSQTTPRLIMDFDDWKEAGLTPWEVFLTRHDRLRKQLETMIDEALKKEAVAE